jgi:hypothetical protein
MLQESRRRGPSAERLSSLPVFPRGGEPAAARLPERVPPQVVLGPRESPALPVRSVASLVLGLRHAHPSQGSSERALLRRRHLSRLLGGRQGVQGRRRLLGPNGREPSRAEGAQPLNALADAGDEPRESSVAELSLLLTLAYLRASAAGLSPAAPDSAFNQPTSDRAELRFLTGAAVVILSRRNILMRS